MCCLSIPLINGTFPDEEGDEGAAGLLFALNT